MVLAGHGSVYGEDALLTSPAHRGVVRRRTSPGRSEGVGARDLRRGSCGQTPTPKPGEAGRLVLAKSTWRSDGLKCLLRRYASSRGETGQNGLGTSGRYVCLCGYLKCLLDPEHVPRKTGLCSDLCAPCSVLWVFWTYRNISRAEFGAQATHLTDKLDATLHIGPPPTPATFALRQDDRATGRRGDRAPRMPCRRRS